MDNYNLVPVHSLRPHPKNPKTHPEAQIEKLMDSIRRFGWTRPIITTADHTILAGHGAWQAAQRLGIESVPVVTANLTEQEQIAYLIADNRLSELGAWHPLALEEALAGLSDSLKQLVAFTENDLDRLVREFQTKMVTPEEDLETLAKDAAQKHLASRVQLGQVWQVGRHRVMCGDSRSRKDVAILLAEATVDAVITDPPYELPTHIIRECLDNLAQRAIVLCGGQQAFTLSNADWRYVNDFIWYRSTPRSIASFARAVLYHNNIVIIAKGKTSAGWKRPTKNWGSVITLDEPDYPVLDFGHAKPVALFQQMLAGFRWKIWADPFLGSAASLLACELLGKTCYGMELDPATLAVALARCERYGLEVAPASQVPSAPDTAATPKASRPRAPKQSPSPS